MHRHPTKEDFDIRKHGLFSAAYWSRDYRKWMKCRRTAKWSSCKGYSRNYKWQEKGKLARNHLFHCFRSIASIVRHSLLPFSLVIYANRLSIYFLTYNFEKEAVGHSQHNIESHLFLGGRFCIAGSKQEF
jgi:hypothetical protein